MDDDFSFSHENNDIVETEDDVDRDKQLEEDLEDGDDVSDDEANESDSSSDSSDSDSSDEESTLSHHSRSEASVEQSSIRESYAHSVQPNEPNQHSEIIRPEIPAIEQHSGISDSEVHYSRISNVNYSNNSAMNNSRNSHINDSKKSDRTNSTDQDDDDSVNSDGENSDLNDSRNSDKMNDTNNSNVHQLYASDVNQENLFHIHKPFESQVNYESILEQKSDVFSASHKSHFFPESGTEALTLNADQYDYGDVITRKSPEQLKYQELFAEYKKLQAIHNNQSQMLSQIKREEIRVRGNLEKDIKSLSSRSKIIEAENVKLTASLQQAQNTISNIIHENNELKGRLNALEISHSSEKTAKEAALAKLESAEITIQSLEQQIKATTQSENAIRMQQQNESVIKDLKLRHQKEVLKYKEEIDRLQGNLNDKINESETLKSNLSQLRKKNEELENENCEAFNKYSAKLKATQKEYKNLLESGNITEVANLSHQLKILKEENSKQEKLINSLKVEVKSLNEQLRAIETTNILTLEKESLSEKHNIGESSQSDSVIAKLQQSLKINQTLRMDNESYKEKIEKLERKLSLEEESAKLFESLCKESQSKIQELEKKLEEVLPCGSIPISQHEIKVKSLESEIVEYQKKLYDLSEKMKASSSIGDKLHEENEILKRKNSEMLEKHAEEKIKIAQHYQAKYEEEIEKVVEKIKQDLMRKADSELKTVKWNYENKNTELQKEIKELRDELYDARAQYVKICEEHKILQTMPQAKELKEIRLSYEKKLQKIKQKNLEDIAQVKSTLQNELEKSKTEWTEQKLAQIKEFVDQTKQQLDEEFIKCIDIEKSKLQAERQQIVNEYQQKLKSLQDKFETEKNNLHAKFQLKWESEMKKVELDHQTEIESITREYNKKITALENELSILKEKNSYDFEQKAEMEKLKTAIMQHYEKEMHDNVAKLKEDFQTKWKNEKKELQKSHQNEIESLEAKFQNEIMVLEERNKTLKEIHLEEIKSKEIQILKLKSDALKNELDLKNADEAQKKLAEKVEQYKKTIYTFKKYHRKKSGTLQEQIEKLTNSVVDKENELQSMKHEYDSYKQSLEETRQKYSSIKNAQCQTEDKVVPIGTLYNAYNMFKQYLKSISEKFIAFIHEYQKRNAERLIKALNFNYDYSLKMSKKFQDELKDTCSISPDIGISRVTSNLKTASGSKDYVNSPKDVRHQLRSEYKVSNSTPLDSIITGDNQKNLRSQMDHLSNVKILQNAQTTPDIDNGFADISFDFLPIKMCHLDPTSVKIPDRRQYI